MLDSQLHLNEEVQALRLAKQGLIYYAETRHLAYQQENCTYYPMSVQGGHLDLAVVLAHLGSLGYHDVWVEAGSQLFAALHRAGLVNRTYIYIAPTILGKAGLSLYANMDSFAEAQAVNWQIMDDNVILKIDW